MIPVRNIRRFFFKALKQPGYAVRVFNRRFAAYRFYRRGTGRAGYPEALTLFLTHRCNLKCKMCGQWGESGVTKNMAAGEIGKEIPFRRLKDLVDELSSFKPNITLFGGEPLLYGNCVELIKHIKDKGMHCVMITNGYMLLEEAEKLIDAGLDELNVSLDGKAELHDHIRGMPGLFDRIAGGLKKIDQLKKEKGLKKPLVNLQCTITKYNYRHLDQMVDVARETGASSLTYHNLIFLGKQLVEAQKEYDGLLGCSSSGWEGFVFEPGIDPEKLHETIRSIRRGHHAFSVDFYPNFSLKGLTDYYRTPSFLPEEYPGRCISPWVAAYIFPDGGIRPCLNCTYSFGNVESGGFMDGWNSEKAVTYRKKLLEKSIFPVCARCTELYRY